jgi:hypothetical protein
MTAQLGNRQNGRESPGCTAALKDKYTQNYQSLGKENHGYGFQRLDRLFEAFSIKVFESVDRLTGIHCAYIGSPALYTRSV